MKKLLLFLFALVTMATHAQSPGDVAQTYGANTGFNGTVFTLVVQPDGKILVGGSFSTYKGDQENKIIRLNTDGTKDTTFTTGTGFSGSVHSIVLQTDGKILVGGNFTTYNGVTENNIIRLNSDGSKDTTFNTGTGFNSIVYSIALQADGKILIGGNFTTYKGVTENGIIRLNTNGSKNTTFSTGTGFSNSNVYTIKLQSDGKILVGGSFNAYNGSTENNIVRLNSDGSNDTTFNTGTGFDKTVWTINLQSDGKILVGGSFNTYKGITENNIIRLNTNGNKDTTFNTGTGFNNVVLIITIQTDGKILLGGIFTSYNGTTTGSNSIRLNSNGTKDATFNTGTGFNGVVNAIVPQSNGKILVGGGFSFYIDSVEKRIISLNNNGSKDATFDSEAGFNDIIYTFKLQEDGKILVGGNFTNFKGTFGSRIIRLNPDGSKDATFTTIGIGFNSTVFTLAQQTDGKILIGGNFSTYNGGVENRIIRLNEDGTKDVTFNTGTGFNGRVDRVVLQTDGKILIGGAFSNYNGSTANRIIRLNTDGTKDETFNTGTGFNNSIYEIKIQDDGKILVGGIFTNYNGSTENRIIRLNTDGTKDASFNIGTGFDSLVQTIALQTDGKILVGGSFTNYNGVTNNGIIRLDSNGSKDTTFNSGTGFNFNIRSIMQLTNGKIIVGGQFNTYNGVTENKIISLNTDGTKNTTFNAGTGFDADASHINELADGKILIGGAFTTYKGDNSSAYLIKLHTEASISNTAVLTQIGNEGDEPNTVTSTVTTAQLGQILPSITDIVVANEAAYEAYIDANPALFASPATATEVQAMVTAVNAALSTDNFEATTKLTVYPNPAQNVLHLQSNNFTTIKDVKIYDLQGKLILENTNTTINVNHLSNGLYIVKVVTEEGEVTKKFIKE